ncbi:MAG: hypothetical protein ABI193_03700 [Minicystis sp.]
MREGLLGALIQGDKTIWALLAALWLVTTILVVFRRSSYGRGAPSTSARVFVLLGATSILSLSALPLSRALAIPRVRWKNVDAPDLVSPTGDTWRHLRGPAVAVMDHGLPDVAIPTLDAQDRWILVGLLSGRPVAGLAPAPVAPLETGVPRICRSDGASCRPWPAGWPDPSRPIGTGELLWAKEASANALAYDAETGHYLQGIIAAPEAEVPVAPGTEPAVLELAGRIANDAPREGASVLFLLRRAVNDRLHTVRVVSVSTPAGKSFHLQRSSVSLTAGPRALRWLARPALLATTLALPIGLLVYAYVWLSSRGRRGRDSSPALSQRSAGRLNALSAVATLAAGIAAGAPAVVAIASLWGSR